MAAFLMPSRWSARRRGFWVSRVVRDLKRGWMKRGPRIVDSDKTMGVPDVEQAKRRLQDILRRAQKLELPMGEIISTRGAQKLLARTKNIVTWSIWIGILGVILSWLVYAHWPSQVEVVRTVLRHTVSTFHVIFITSWDPHFPLFTLYTLLR